MKLKTAFMGILSCMGPVWGGLEMARMAINTVFKAIETLLGFMGMNEQGKLEKTLKRAKNAKYGSADCEAKEGGAK